MLRGKHGVGLLLGTAVVLVLSACATPAPAVTKVPTAVPVVTPSPAFTSDAAALATASDRYRRYSELEDDSLRGSKTAQEDLRSYMSAGDWLEDEKSTRAFLATTNKFEGHGEVTRIVPQSIDRVHGTVSFYACENLSGTRIVDSNGRDITPNTRAKEQTFTVTIKSLPGPPVEIESIQWSGTSVC